MPHTYVFNPVGFDPMEVLPPELRRHADCARNFLHTIIMHGQVAGLAKRDGFVLLKAAYLSQDFPGDDHYKKVRDALIAGGSIVCDGRYIKGEKSYGYKLGKELEKMRQHRVEVTNRTLLKKLRGRHNEHMIEGGIGCFTQDTDFQSKEYNDFDSNYPNRLTAPDPVHRYLRRHLCGLEIDFPAALEALLAGEHEPSDETSIQMIRDRQFFFGVCAYGRVHTNLTNLKSGMRRFLTHQGRPLVNLDIRNSQPLFFVRLLGETCNSRPMPADARHYIDLVQAGRFYDHLMIAGGIPPEGRQMFKRDFFGRVFFCKNDPIHESARLFGEEFPSVYATVRSMKDDDYCALAHRLQRAESDLMIGKVATRIMTEMPDAFIATIHDSVVTTSDKVELVKNIILDEFLKIGLIPTINPEPLNR